MALNGHYDDDNQELSHEFARLDRERVQEEKSKVAEVEAIVLELVANAPQGFMDRETLEDLILLKLNIEGFRNQWPFNETITRRAIFNLLTTNQLEDNLNGGLEIPKE